MKIAIPKERRAHERRVAATPETVRKYVGLGFAVAVEAGAGAGASFSDEAYSQAGATIAADEASLLADADIVLKLQRPMTTAEGGPDELAMLKRGAILVGQLAPYQSKEQIKAYADAGIAAFAMELLPRISRAQSMDVLSSQANLAGYKAVIDAAVEFGKAFPMMMTAAGTVAPARVLVLGVGVAGLQAIATARRLGAIVSGYDVRPAVKEQVQSLGASFVEVDEAATKEAETAGGYAKEMSEEYKQKQAQVLREHLKKQDVAITTALIPGRPAPVLISEEMVKEMRPGSVIVDLAVEAGGNCPLSELDKVVVKHGVTIVGHANYPSRIAVDASALYARNLLNFLAPFAKEGRLEIAWDDELVKGTLLARDGAINPKFV
jgi:NAD(P) transhydrogenase subunit alpha